MVESKGDSIGPEVLLKQKNKEKENLPAVVEIMKRLERGKIKVRDNPTEENKVKFEEAMTVARKREQVDTKIARARSRIKWLQEEDAPSRYFFCLR
ncbi:hypothetical protein R1sor_013852 [Riccia sorocarpa]|uniref:Uncharacterized protein n=1 Tax=Riccia sorocarpa TaxID=122646 RepID=A0ABD3H7R7_9MARC